MDDESAALNELIAFRNKVLKDLGDMGFSVPDQPEKPDLSVNFSELESLSLRRLYDTTIAYFEYITNIMIRLKVFKSTAEEAVAQVNARLTLAAAKEKSLSNAELRKAWITTNPDMTAVTKDFNYFKCLYDANSELRDTYKYAMRRMYQELFSRGIRVPEAGSSGGDEPFMRTNRTVGGPDGEEPHTSRGFTFSRLQHNAKRGKY